MKIEMVDVKSEDSVTSDGIDDNSTTQSSSGASVSQSAVSQNIVLQNIIIISKERFHLLHKIKTFPHRCRYVFGYEQKSNNRFEIGENLVDLSC